MEKVWKNIFYFSTPFTQMQNKIAFIFRKMKWENEMSIKQKLIIGFGTLVFILSVFGVYVYNGLNTFDNISDKKAEKYNQLVNVEIIRNINTSISFYAMDLIVKKDKGIVSKEYRNNINSLFDKIWKYKKEFHVDTDTKEKKQLVHEIMMAFQKLEPIVKNILPTLIEEKASVIAFEELDGKIDAATGMMDHHIKKTIKLIESELKEASLSEESYSKDIKQYIILTIILAIIISLLIGLYITKNITDSLKEFQSGLLDFFKFLNKEINDVTLLSESKDEIGEMAKVVNENIKNAKENIDEDRKFIEETIAVLSEFEKGDLCQRINISVNNPALMQLKKVLDSMATNLETNINNVLTVLNQYTTYNYLNKVDDTQVKEHLLQLANGVNLLGDSITTMLIENKKNGLTLNGSADILLKNVDTLNLNANETAASLEETAAALEEITSTIISNTDNINEMSSYASKVTSSVEQGNELANQTTLAMDEINEQVSSINEAITVIDQIAFQTNILSLNAAVEAATAGEAGKGFAVVAQEVRNLASRSAEAAKEIKLLVENANSKANEGKKISDEMINGYTLLNGNIKKTIDLIKQVESSSKEQQVGIEQINNAVTLQDQQTQKLASIAMQTQKVANNTSNISKKVVRNANEKEFIGKDNIQTNITEE